MLLDSIIDASIHKGKGKVFYGQGPPGAESTTTELGSIINYFQ